MKNRAFGALISVICVAVQGFDVHDQYPVIGLKLSSCPWIQAMFGDEVHLHDVSPEIVVADLKKVPSSSLQCTKEQPHGISHMHTSRWKYSSDGVSHRLTCLRMRGTS